MTFFDKVHYQMKLNGIKNIHQLSSKIGIPDTTIRHWDGVPSDVIRYSNIKTLSEFFDVSEMYWADGNVALCTEEKEESSIILTSHEREVIEAYRKYEFKDAIDSILGLKKTGTELSSKEAKY